MVPGRAVQGQLQQQRWFGHARGANSCRPLGAGASPLTVVSPLHVVLVQPDIPSNTGAAGRTCLGFGAVLHLVEPLGFDLCDKRVKRAGLDYWSHVDLRVHATWSDLVHHLSSPPICMQPGALFFITKFGDVSLCDVDFVAAAATGQTNRSQPLALVFGSETRGLSAIETDPAYANGVTVGLPMHNTEVLRSLNLSTCVAVVLWEAYRQIVQGSRATTSEG